MLNKVSKLLREEIAKNNEQIKDIDVRLLLLSDNYEKIINICKDMEDNFTVVDIDSIKNIIDGLDFADINNDDLIELENIKKIYEFLNDPQLPNVGIKKEKLIFIRNFKKKLDCFKENISNDIKNEGDKLENYRKINDNCSYYISKLDKEFFIRESVLEVNKFFDFLDGISINKNILLDMIYSIMEVRFNNIEGSN